MQDDKEKQDESVQRCRYLIVRLSTLQRSMKAEQTKQKTKKP